MQSAIRNPKSETQRLFARACARWNALLNHALDAATETAVIILLFLWCELGRLKDRIVWRARTKTVCAWCKRTLRLRYCFWQRDSAHNVSHGLCRACQQRLLETRNP